MARQQSRIERSLRTKFHFSDSPGKGRAHIYIERDLPDGRFALTKFSHGTHEIDKGLLSAIARQLGVCRQDLLEMIGCTMSEQAYLDKAKPPAF